MNETTTTKITAPSIDGIRAIPANAGPHEPNIDCPIEEPINPATILAITPIECPLLVIAPAIAPIIAPTIKDHIKPPYNLYIILILYYKT